MSVDELVMFYIYDSCNPIVRSANDNTQTPAELVFGGGLAF